jgi:hypothetical protein
MIKYSRSETQNFEKYYLDYILMNEDLHYYDWLKKEYGATLEIKHGFKFNEIDTITFENSVDELMFKLKFNV